MTARPLRRSSRGASRRLSSRGRPDEGDRHDDQFRPDLEIFDELEWSEEILIQRLRETAFLTEGLRIVLVDEREGEERHEFYARAASATSSPT